MSLLESITEEQKQNAFEKTREKFKFDEGKLVRVTEEYYRAGLDFARDVFNVDEPVTSVSDAQWGPGLEEGWRKVFELGFSLMVVNEETGETIAFRVTRIHQVEVGYGLDQVTDPGTKRVWEYVQYCDERAKLFEQYGFKEALHLVGLAVNPKYRQRGIAQKIMEAAIYMYQNLGVGPILVKGEASSNFSKKVYARTGFTELYDLPYDQYIVGGEQVFKNTGVHKSMKCFGKVLQKPEEQ